MATPTTERFRSPTDATGIDEMNPVNRTSPYAADSEQSLTTKATDKAKEAASFVGDKMEQATEAVGAGLEAAGKSIREHAPNQGILANAGEAIGARLEAGGHYLEEHGLKGIAGDVTNVIRRNPIPLLLCGLGVGFLIARIVRR